MVTVAENTPQNTGAFAVIDELNKKFSGQFIEQKTFDNFPTIWVERSQLLDVLLFLRKLPKPYVMLLDLSAIDERLRQHRDGQPDSDFTVFYHLMSIERNSDIRVKVAFGQMPTGMSVKSGICSVSNLTDIRI